MNDINQTATSEQLRLIQNKFVEDLPIVLSLIESGDLLAWDDAVTFLRTTPASFAVNYSKKLPSFTFRKRCTVGRQLRRFFLRDDLNKFKQKKEAKNTVKPL